MPQLNQRSFARAPVIVAAIALGTVLSAQAPPKPQQAPPQPQQPEQQPQQRPPTFRTQANFVRVDVYPTRAGAAVMDLKVEDFEVLEDGVAQSIQAFEHVVVRGGGPGEQRAEPNTIAESNQLAANARNRVFVLFLDPSHVQIASSWNIRGPLVKMIGRMLGPDDLIGIMTPMMSASELTLARKTAVIEGGLLERWPWGERFTTERDEREQMYEMCYPPLSQEMRAGMSTSWLAQQMIARRRERRTLDAMRDLVLHLRDIREERKAIITVSEGWLLYRPDTRLTTLRQDAETGVQEQPPGPQPIGVGPGGKITMGDPRNPGSGDLYQCNTDRMQLAQIDDDRYFRDILGEANRGNASFYTVDPRGLAVFDSPIGPDRPPPISVDMGMLKTRQDALRTLADATDGLAAMNSNDLDKSLRQISDDLSSYYLLGYYSTNTKLDGRFRTLKVRVKRPGVDVRARRGYRAATEEEVAAARAASEAPISEETSALTAAIGTLDRVRPSTPFYLHAIAAPAAAGGVSRLWVVGEFQPAPAPDPWAKGATADLEIGSGSGLTKAQVTLAAGSRAFVTQIDLPSPVAGGMLDVRARVVGVDPAAERTNQIVRVNLGAPPHALLFRRGPATGNRLQPVATFQCTRTDRVRLELPVGADAGNATARLLGKTGQPIAIPITVGERVDEAIPQRWLTADLSLAPLAMGDYVIELTFAAQGTEQRVLTPFRVAR